MSSLKRINPKDAIGDNQIAVHTTQFGGVNILITLEATEEGGIEVLFQTDREDLTKKQELKVKDLVQQYVQQILGAADED